MKTISLEVNDDLLAKAPVCQNKDTRQAIEDLDNGVNVERFDTPDELFQSLGI